MIMDVSVIAIGNSKGIRLTKTLIEKYDIKDSLELIMKDDYIILKPNHTPRKNWEKAFKKMNEEKDDELLIPDVFDDENFDVWN